MANNLTEQHGQVSVTVRRPEGGVKDLDVWDASDYPEASNDVTKHRSGGMRSEKLFSGLSTLGDVKLSRPYSDDIEGHLWLYDLVVTKGAEITLGFQDLDVDGNRYGRVKTFYGKIKSMGMGKYDSNSTDPRMVELDVVIAGADTARR